MSKGKLVRPAPPPAPLTNNMPAPPRVSAPTSTPVPPPSPLPRATATSAEGPLTTTENPAPDNPIPANPDQTLQQRPYLAPRSPQKRGSPAQLGELDVTKLLTSSAPVSWGVLLNLLPDAKVQELLREAKAPRPPSLPAAISEAAALHNTLLHAEQLTSSPADPPENMFAPFSLAHLPDAIKPPHAPSNHVHWAHVDSGSMVCLVHEGVVHHFGELASYRKPWRHCVTGVGGRRVDIVGKLVDVPITLGDDPGKGVVVRTTLYVLGGCMSYHWLLGLTFLEPIDAAIFCKTRVV